MGAKKSWGVNEKAAEARDRKASAKASNKASQEAAKEDAYWAQHENPNRKKDAKRQEEERKREEAAARKAELKKLAAAEEEAMANIGKKKPASKVGASKVTQHQLNIMREQEKKQGAIQAEERDLAKKRTVQEDKYAAQLEVEISNRQENTVEARSLDAAVQALSIGDGAAVDRHPEKRAKAMWEAYYEEQLPLLKEEKPGLKLMQYKNMIFDKWQKSPLNPRNFPKE